MPELDFKLLGCEPAKHAAAPTLCFKLALSQREPAVPIQNVTLQCQIRIEARQRSYAPSEQEGLTDLFGEPSRWGETLHSMLWVQTHVTVPPFERDCAIDVPVFCSFDFNIAATKYLHGVRDGVVPLLLLFSGSVFYRDEDGQLAMDLISWNKEAQFSLPVRVWQDMMDTYYPNIAWLCVSRPVFEALYEYKRRRGYTGFDEVLTSLIPPRENKVAAV